MQKVTISKRSWHYRLNDKAGWIGGGGDDLCSYWRSTLLNLLSAAFAISVIAFFVVGILYFVYLLITIFFAAPVETGIGLALSAAFGLVVYALRKFRTYCKHKRTAVSVSNQPSLIAARYQSWKDKVCVRLEFVDD